MGYYYIQIDRKNSDRMAIRTGADAIIGIGIFQLIFGVFLAIIELSDVGYDSDF